MRRAATVFIALTAALLVAVLALIVPRASTAGPILQLTQTLPPTGAVYLPVVANPPTPTIPPTATLAPTVTPTEIPGLPKIKNGDFEQGHANWTEIPGNAIITQFSAVTPHSGEWLARLGGEVSSTAEIQQSIAAPNSTPLYLHFCAQYTANGAGPFDDFVISAGATEIIRIPLFLNGPDTQEWGCGGIDISSFAGQTILLRFHLDFPGASNGVGLYLDDIAFSSHP
jgi:hypothetical protein